MVRRRKGIMFCALCISAVLVVAGCGKEKKKQKLNLTSGEEVTTEAVTPTDAGTEQEIDTEGYVTMNFWTADIPEGLIEDTDSEYNEESYGYYYFRTADEEESLTISVSNEDALDFRKDLITEGIDLQAYANGNVQMQSIGGLDFAVAESDSWGTTRTIYMARDEKSQFSVQITISGDAQSEDMQTVLDTIIFTLPEGSEVDAPYPWDGEPFVTQTGSASVGSYTVSATQIVADQSILINDIFENQLQVSGQYIYALGDDTLYIYSMEGDSAVLQDTIVPENDEDYGILSMDDNGVVYMSGFYESTLEFSDGLQSGALDTQEQMAVSPDGTFGITYFVQASDLEKVNITSTSTFETEEFALSEEPMSVVSYLTITQDYILISGSAADDSGHKVFVFDHSGNYIRTLADEDGSGLGSITGMVQTANGILALDGNMRELVMWDNDGNWIGSVKDSDIFGTRYPWIGGISKAADGSIYVSLVEERTDMSWDEMVIYRLDTDF